MSFTKLLEGFWQLLLKTMDLARCHEVICWTRQRPLFRGTVSLHQGPEQVGQVSFSSGAEGVVIGPTEDTRLEIHPAWRGNGLGSLLLEGTVKYIRELVDHYDFSPRRIYACPLREKVAAQKIFEENQFSPGNPSSRWYLTYERWI